MSEEVKEVTSKRGFPAVKVIEDVAVFLSSEGDITVEEGVRRIEESYRKYKSLEGELMVQKARMSAKLPDMQKSLKILKMMEEKQGKPLEVTTLLSEQVYARAVADHPNKISLWLGANVMVEYEIEEAKAIIEKNYSHAQRLVREFDEELKFVKDQITTSEVNIAHVYNHGVHLKKAATASN